MKNWKVTSHKINLLTNEIIGEERVNIISRNNILFKECKTAEEIKGKYQAFWNLCMSVGKVVVTDVKEINNGE